MFKSSIAILFIIFFVLSNGVSIACIFREKIEMTKEFLFGLRQVKTIFKILCERCLNYFVIVILLMLF